MWKGGCLDGGGGGDLIPQSHSFCTAMPYPELLSPLSRMPFPFSMAVFTLETEKQMDKVRRIVHPNLRPSHFQIKAYYLSDANYLTDNPSQV